MSEVKTVSLLERLDGVSVSALIFASLLLGLAPFQPEPHVWQKLKMLAGGELARPIDIFDLFMHGTPILLLITRVLRMGMASINRSSG